MTPWPQNQPFRSFAALVADGVQFALAQGWTIWIHRGLTKSQRRCCPIGAALLLRGYGQSAAFGVGFPTRASAADALGVLHSRVQDFTIGFDGLLSDDRIVSRPYFLLGQAYRERFIKRRGFDTPR
jgi:hypothetical protein